MHNVLQFQYKMQRKANTEFTITVACIVALTVFFTANLCLHTFVEELDDSTHNGEGEAPMARLLRPKKKQRTGKQLRKSLVRYEPDPTVTTLRQTFEREHPNDDPETIYKSLQDQREPHAKPPADMAYDIFHCPATPPPEYPARWNAIGVLQHWNPDVTTVPSDFIHQGLCVFDWRNPEDQKVVETYRRAEVPFVLQNHPEVAKPCHRWQQPGYLQQLIGTAPQRNEHGPGNHLMFWRKKGGAHGGKDWSPPTENVEMNVAEWLEKAETVEHLSDAQQVRAEHWYFRLNAALPDLNTYLYDELPLFQPVDTPTLFMVDSSQQRGINCRLGMRGSIAEAHFDPTRNWILLLKGRRRYILAHPDQCRNMELYPMGHPSGRHSAVNWSNVTVEQHHEGPFREAQVTEVVLQAGDALYLPTSWFHFIVSLNTNYQCNARSGATKENWHAIEQCGFAIPKM